MLKLSPSSKLTFQTILTMVISCVVSFITVGIATHMSMKSHGYSYADDAMYSGVLLSYSIALGFPVFLVSGILLSMIFTRLGKKTSENPANHR